MTRAHVSSFFSTINKTMGNFFGRRRRTNSLYAEEDEDNFDVLAREAREYVARQQALDRANRLARPFQPKPTQSRASLSGSRSRSRSGSRTIPKSLPKSVPKSLSKAQSKPLYQPPPVVQQPRWSRLNRLEFTPLSKKQIPSPRRSSRPSVGFTESYNPFA